MGNAVKKITSSPSTGAPVRIIQCPSCQTKFALDATVIQDIADPRFHCSRCDHIFNFSEGDGGGLQGDSIGAAPDFEGEHSSANASEITSQHSARIEAEPVVPRREVSSSSGASRLEKSWGTANPSRKLEIPKTISGSIIWNAPHEAQAQASEHIGAPSQMKLFPANESAGTSYSADSSHTSLGGSRIDSASSIAGVGLSKKGISKAAQISNLHSLGAGSAAGGVASGRKWSLANFISPLSSEQASSKQGELLRSGPSGSGSSSTSPLHLAKVQSSARALFEHRGGEEHPAIAVDREQEYGRSAAPARGLTARAETDYYSRSPLEAANYQGEYTYDPSSVSADVNAGLYRRPKSGFWWIALPTLIATLIFALLALIVTASPTLQAQLTEALSPSTFLPPPAGLEVQEVSYQKLALDNGEVIDLISGKVVNGSQARVKQILFDGVLFDRKGEVINRARVVAGSGITKGRLKALTPDVIKTLQSGQVVRQFELRPGASSEFNIALFNDRQVGESLNDGPGSKTHPRSFLVQIHSVKVD